MFTSKPPARPIGSAAVTHNRSGIAEDMLIEGNIISKGFVEFGGQIMGDLTADTIILTATAFVHGRVRARQLTIEGELQGAATALSVRINNGARVKANFAYDTLEIAAGAQVDGTYRRVSPEKFTL